MIAKLPRPLILPTFPNLAEAIKRHPFLTSLILALTAAAIITGSLVAHRTAADPYVTQTVLRADLPQTVTASGTVNPQDTISVGTQISGTIQSISVDYNSVVRKGQVLAQLDPSQLDAQLEQAQGALAQAQGQAAASDANANGAQANISVAQATSASQADNAQATDAAIQGADANTVKAQSALALAQQTLQRDRQLLSQGYIPQNQYDTDSTNAVAAESALQSAQAAASTARAQASAGQSQAQASSGQVAVAAAQALGSVDTAQAQQGAVQSARAVVQQDQLNLAHATITSPVDGTVIARNVSVGQTVASSLQTPTLFTIAKNLKKMEVDIAVGEPDIGNVSPGDAVGFSVLAYPNETFRGLVSQVRENPATVQNVVTYTVITLVNNSAHKLLPGMTANATITVKTARNALVVPTQALSWRPAGSTARRRGTAQSSAAGTKVNASAPWGQTAASAAGTVPGNTSMLFVERDGKVSPVRVRIDLISGTQAAVAPLSGTLNADDSVIIGSSNQAANSAQRSAASSPVGGSMAGGIGRAVR